MEKPPASLTFLKQAALFNCMGLRIFPRELAQTIPWELAQTIPYGLCPMPPSSVMVSPVIYLKSGEASCTHTRPISSSASP